MPTALATPAEAGLTVRLLVREPHYLDRAGRIRSGRPLALLAYLLLRRTPPTRDELLDLLWPAEPGQDLHHRLRTLLYQMRQDVGASVIRLDGRQVVIERALVRCDALDFVAHIEAGRIDAAIGLYEAPFLTQGVPACAPVFEEWATGVRARLRTVYGKALLAEADASSTRDPARYTDIAEALLRLDPGDPAAAEHALRAALARDDHDAIREAIRRLRRDLEVSGTHPAAGTADLLVFADARAREPAPPSESATFDPPFTGRAAELALIRSVLARTQEAGCGRVIAIAGQSGVGKTRFLGELDALARIGDVRILHARAYEVDSRTPYALIADVLRPLFDQIPMRLVPRGSLEAIGTIIPDVAPATQGSKTSPAVEPVQIHAAVASLLESVSRDRTLVLSIDDVHWADEQSRACLHRIALRTVNCPIVLALAFRDAHELLVAPLFAAVPVEMCRLRPLDRDEVEELLTGIAVFADADHRERLVRTMLACSGGSPLQLIQHLSHLREVGLLAVRNGTWELMGQLLDSAPGRAAEPVVALISRRLEGLSDSERNVLAACAVLERFAAPRDIAAVAGFRDQRIADQLDTLLRQQLVHAEGLLVGVAHAEIGNAALRSVHGHRRQEMFEAALRLGESDVLAQRSGLSSFARLRLACGAADRSRAHLALLEVLRDSRGFGGEELTRVAESVLLSAREWCPDPDFFAHLHRESQRAAGDPERIERHIRAIRRRHTARLRLLRAELLPPVVLVLIMVLAIVLPGRHEGGPLGFGGGGIMLLTDSAGTLRGLRFAGPNVADTVSARIDRKRFEPVKRHFELLSPDGRFRLTECYPAAGGPPDVCIENSDSGGRTVLATSPGDDHPAGWSPDGRFALIVSDREPRGRYNYDIFTVDIASGATRNITADDYQSNWAEWSTDGTRIAFARRRPDGSAVVVAGADGTVLRTVEFEGEARSSHWSPDGARIAVNTATGTTPEEIWIIDLTTGGAVRRVRGSGRVRGWSPDGRYLAVQTAARVLKAGSGLDWRELNETRLLLVSDSSDLLMGTLPGYLVTWIPPRPRPYIERLQVPETVNATTGERVRLPIAGIASSGRQVELPSFTMETTDPAVAFPGGGDTIFAAAAGSTMIDVSAGGWRKARIALHVRPATAARLLFEERWRGGVDTTRWQYYGTPASGVVTTTRGRGMRNNGDSAYLSGLVTRQAFSPADGLGIEWTQLTPLTGDFWQELWIDASPAGLSGFATGLGVPYVDSLVVLAAQTPLLIGQPGQPWILPRCGTEPIQIRFDQVFSRTRFDRVLLQAYPSGGCDLFVNGKLIARLRPLGPRSWPDSVRIAVGGRSYRTDMLIGEFRVWQGIVSPRR